MELSSSVDKLFSQTPDECIKYQQILLCFRLIDCMYKEDEASLETSC